MKKVKVFAVILTGIMVFSLAACGQKKPADSTPAESASSKSVSEAASSAKSAEAESVSEAESASSESAAAESASEAESISAESTAAESSSQSEAEAIVGGWSKADSPVVTDEAKALLEKATEGLTGASYAPIAYLGSQVVAGTNHRLLVTITPVVPDAVPSYAIVTIYEDLQGNAEITEILECNAGPEDGGLLGGWSAPETPDVTDKAEAALKKAAEKMLGAEYVPLALLATQIVSGTNYSILCEVTAVSPSAEPKYVIANVYEDLQGNAEMQDTFDFVSVEE